MDCARMGAVTVDLALRLAPPSARPCGTPNPHASWFGVRRAQRDGADSRWEREWAFFQKYQFM